MTWVRVPQSEYDRIRKLSANKKAKREEKRKALPWGADKGGGKSAQKGPPKKRRKKSNRQRLVKILDTIFSLFVRLRAKHRTGGNCEVCARRPIEHCFHWIGRGDFSTRWDPDNAIGSCRGCNLDEHYRKRVYRDKHIALVGLEVREALEAKARIMIFYSESDLTGMIATFKKRIEDRAW